MTKLCVSISAFIFLILGMMWNAKSTNHFNEIYIQQLVRQTRLVDNRHTTVKPSKKDQEQLQRKLKCLAYNIYFEARGEPFLGQVAVARVVMNRVRDSRFPNNVCSVVYQKTKVFDDETEQHRVVCQFSWVCEGQRTPNTKSNSYKQAMDIAKKVLVYNNWSDLLSDNVLYFHSNYVNPGWGLQHVATIGNHLFFNDRRRRSRG